MKWLVVASFFLSSYNFLNAQSTIYIGTQSYPATSVFKGSVKNGYPTIGHNGRNEDGDVYVVVGKKKDAGLLMLGVRTSQKLIGDAMIYLVDGNVIRCKDRGLKDRFDGESTSIFYLTSAELELLKKSDIRSVRFSLSLYGMEKYSWTGYNFDKSAASIKKLFN
jgi:hypothetical protein